MPATAVLTPPAAGDRPPRSPLTDEPTPEWGVGPGGDHADLRVVDGQQSLFPLNEPLHAVVAVAGKLDVNVVLQAGGVPDLSGTALARAVINGTGWERLVAGWLATYDSTHTRHAYWRDLHTLAVWATNAGKSVLELTLSDLAGFKAQLADNGLSPATIARRLAAISAFYRHLRAEGITERNPVEFLRRPTIRQEPGSGALTRTQAAQLLDIAHTAGPRDHLLVCLLLLNGLRVSEACSADIEDLGATLGHHTLRIHRKGGTHTRIPLAPRTWSALGAHLDERGNPAVGPVLTDLTGERLDRHDATRILTRLCRRADLPKTSPHGLRHTFVTTARAAGVDLRDIQHAAGHADPRTTMRYDHTTNHLDRHPTYTITTHLTR